MNKRLLFVAGSFLLLLCGTTSARLSDGEPTLQFVLDKSDIVLHATVEKTSRQKAVPRPNERALSEDYSISHLSGTAAYRDGTKPIRGRYLLRTTALWTNEQVFAEGFEAIFFVKGNGTVTDPILLQLPVVDGKVLHNNQPIVVSDRNSLEPIPSYNECALEDYHAIYNPEEDLELVSSFTCANGTQWNRGNDAPINARSTAFTPDEFMQTVSDFMVKYNYPDPDITRGLRQPSNAILAKRNLIDDPVVIEGDRHIREILNRARGTTVFNRNPKSQVLIMQFIEREIARGKAETDLPQIVQEIHLPVFKQERARGVYR